MTNQQPPSDLDSRVESLCRSFADVGELDSITPLGPVAEAILKDNADPSGGATRAALIEAIRGGKHVELRARATTFRQRDGSPNKNFLRFKSSKLTEIAASFAGKPFLLDHNKWAQDARMGTIEESEAVPLAGGWTGFRQTLRIVKPHGVISILDGTIDRFSIGWDPRGQVMCTAHGVDVRSRKSCYWTENCYPGKLVEVDGEKKIAEYEWQSTEGLETSGVNSPAVSGTKIENIKTALAAELGLAPSLPAKDPKMPRFPLLLAALALPSTGAAAELGDGDDGTVAARVTELRSELAAATSERDTALKRATDAEATVASLTAQIAKLTGDKVDALLEAKGYRAGKLIRGKNEKSESVASLREPRLRRIAKEDGIAALEAELAEMPVVVPLDRVELAEEDPNPRTTVGDLPDTVLASTAKQLGIKPEDLKAHHDNLRGRAGGKN